MAIVYKKRRNPAAEKAAAALPERAAKIGELPCFAVFFPGYDLEERKTWHLLKLVRATDPYTVGLYVATAFPAHAERCQMLPVSETYAKFDLTNGVDVVLDEHTLKGLGIFGDIGDITGPAMVEWVTKKTQERERPIRPGIIARFLDPRQITLEEFEGMRGNSWEHELLIPKYTDETLIHAAEHCLKNCTRHDTSKPAVVYDDALAIHFAPMLVARLKARLEKEVGVAEKGAVEAITVAVAAGETEI